jgi:hypothetical protein
MHSCSYITFSFNHIFHNNHVPVNILARNFFNSVFITDQHGEAYSHKYPYCVATSQSTLIAFFMKIMSQSKCYKGAFSSQCSSRNCAVKTTDVNIHTKLSHSFNCNCLNLTCVIILRKVYLHILCTTTFRNNFLANRI